MSSMKQALLAVATAAILFLAAPNAQAQYVVSGGGGGFFGFSRPGFSGVIGFGGAPAFYPAPVMAPPVMVPARVVPAPVVVPGPVMAAPYVVPGAAVYAPRAYYRPGRVYGPGVGPGFVVGRPRPYRYGYVFP